MALSYNPLWEELLLKVEVAWNCSDNIGAPFSAPIFARSYYDVLLLRYRPDDASCRHKKRGCSRLPAYPGAGYSRSLDIDAGVMQQRIEGCRSHGVLSQALGDLPKINS